MSDDIRRMTMHVTLDPSDVKLISRVTYEAVRALRIAFGDLAHPSWLHAPSDAQHDTEVIVRRIATGAITSPNAIHKQWRDEMYKAGWRHPHREDDFGPGSQDGQFSVLICDWTELDPVAQTRYCLFFAVASSLLANIAMIVVARRARAAKT